MLATERPLPEAAAPAAAPLEPDVPAGPMSIAILLPLTGRNAELGQSLLDAATLALFDIANDGVVLLPKDTGEDSPATVRAAAEAALAEGARIILGPVFADSVDTVAAIAKPAGVPLIGFSSDRRVAQPGVYLLGHMPEQQVDRVIAYAAHHGIDRVGVLASDDPQGAGLSTVVRDAATARGVLMATPAFIALDAIDLSAAMRAAADFATRPSLVAMQLQSLGDRTDDGALRAREKLAALDAAGAGGYQALVLALSGDRLRAATGLLPYFGLQPPAVRVLGTAAWNQAAMLADPSLRGAWFAAPANDLRERFFARFRDAFGRDAHPIAPIAYDAIALAAALALGGADFSAERLTQPAGFTGVDGVFRFMADGGTERGLAVYEIGDGQAILIDGPPPAFGALTQ